MNKRQSIIGGIDWWSIFLVITIMLFGWLNIYGASYDFDQTSIFDFHNRAGKQFIWMMIAVAMSIVILFIDERIYDVFAYILYGIIVIVLLITPILAHDIKGSYSWLSIGPISIQPAEFAKCFTALALAKYMGRHDYRLRDWPDLVIPFALILIPMFIIMVPQKETGSALVFMSFLLMFYRFGMTGKILAYGLFYIVLFIITIRLGITPIPWGQGDMGSLLSTLLIVGVVCGNLWTNKKYHTACLILVGIIVLEYAIGLLINHFHPINFNTLNIILSVTAVIIPGFCSLKRRDLSIGIVAIFSILAIGVCLGGNYAFNHILKPHQRTRIEVLLGITNDPTGAGYNVNQSLIAIGSGQLTGKGYLQGTQTKMHFVPEQDTDFIFCTVGEEWGFLGSSGLLLLYLALIVRIIVLAERQHDRFSMIYAYCVACILLFHVTINIGMVLGLLPVIGIPLPFFSYGGSAMIGFSLLMAILWRLDAARINKLQ